MDRVNGERFEFSARTREWKKRNALIFPLDNCNLPLKKIRTSLRIIIIWYIITKIKIRRKKDDI